MYFANLQWRKYCMLKKHFADLVAELNTME
jgi:hypothetical protein